MSGPAAHPYGGDVPSDEELRKVAEDLRALARSLARDFWDATQSARGSGRPPGEAFRYGIKGAVRGARRGLRDEMRGHRHGRWGAAPRYRHGWPPPGGPGWPGYGTGGPGGAGVGGPVPRGAQGEVPWNRYGRWPPGPPYRRPGTRRSPVPPPVRRRWDAPVLGGILVALFGVAWVAGALGATPVPAEAVLAAGLMLLGAVLIVTARTDWSLSRHAWPVVLGVVLVGVLFSISASFGVAGAISHLSFGDMRPAPPLRSGTVYGGVGRLTVDAARLADGSTLDVRTIAGETDVSLPTKGTVTVVAHVLAGRVCVDGHDYANGVGASAGPLQMGAGAPDVTIDIHQLAGQVSVGGGACRP